MKKGYDFIQDNLGDAIAAIDGNMAQNNNASVFIGHKRLSGMLVAVADNEQKGDEWMGDPG